MSQSFSFETAYKRLEEILEKLNSEQVSLEDSLKLYEEANCLIVACNAKLTHAEQKVQTLIKGRNQELILQEGSPVLEDFTVSKSHHLTRTVSES